MSYAFLFYRKSVLLLQAKEAKVASFLCRGALQPYGLDEALRASFPLYTLSCYVQTTSSSEPFTTKRRSFDRRNTCSFGRLRRPTPFTNVAYGDLSPTATSRLRLLFPHPSTRIYDPRRGPAGDLRSPASREAGEGAESCICSRTQPATPCWPQREPATASNLCVLFLSEKVTS